jgi:host factor-I protein
MSKAQQLQDPFLNALRTQNADVNIFLMNGIKLKGRIKSFDNFVLIFGSSQNPDQMIYKHAVSTIAPPADFKWEPQTNAIPAE